jgi:hypothetical protein
VRGADGGRLSLVADGPIIEQVSFVELFRFAPSGDEPPPPEQPVRPTWWGPPEDELGEPVACSLVIAHSERAVIALREVVAYSNGLAFDVLAAGRGLREAEANRLFHEQHLFDPDELPDGFLRVGVEAGDAFRASNLVDRRRLWRPDGEPPEGPLLVQSGGGTGSAGDATVRMNPHYWLWPLPPADALRLHVEWPGLGIPLASVELDGAALLEAAARSRPLWAE